MGEGIKFIIKFPTDKDIYEEFVKLWYEQYPETIVPSIEIAKNYTEKWERAKLILYKRVAERVKKYIEEHEKELPLEELIYYEGLLNKLNEEIDKSYKKVVREVAELETKPVPKVTEDEVKARFEARLTLHGLDEKTIKRYSRRFKKAGYFKSIIAQSTSKEEAFKQAEMLADQVAKKHEEARKKLEKIGGVGGVGAPFGRGVAIYPVVKGFERELAKLWFLSMFGIYPPDIREILERRTKELIEEERRAWKPNMSREEVIEAYLRLYPSMRTAYLYYPEDVEKEAIWWYYQICKDRGWEIPEWLKEEIERIKREKGKK